MKKTNFLKGLALAAVALVSGFATSCSEEELSIKNNPVELPAASASVSISVVDLEEGKLVGSVTTLDATASIGGTLTVECPANAGYTTAAPVAVSIPALQKGQSVNVPVTFYVVTLDHALAELLTKAHLSRDYTNAEVETVKATPIDRNGWKSGVYTNDTEFDILDTDYIARFYFKVLSGEEFVSEIESSEEGTGVVAVSRAAETTVMDLLKTLKMTTYETYGAWPIPAMYALSVDVDNFVYTGKLALIDNETGETLAEFIGKWSGGWICNPKYTDLSHAGHDAPSHDGHGHGGNSNAGGGIGGDAEGE